ncbi:GIY-YIG nuclease family protein [Bacillus timonensis]|uniref:GIY-YIG nuclease family protein n=1 Tax=Bacillus timonensis TaxID=1033734 RepID=UPI00028851D1|nr:GIY-YIG nuclease family protein [Bacillus timonensis]
MERNKHFFYVVECKDGTFYAGYTTDVGERLKKHNEGKGAKYTRGRGPITLLFAQEFETKEEAMRAEYRFKQLKRPEKERLLAMESGERYVAAKELSTKL